MSYSATVSRVACASAPTIGRPVPGRPVVRAGDGTAGRARAALASYHCGRSQPPASRKTAPSSCWRAWNGLVRSGRGLLHRLERVQDVVDLDEVLAVAGQHVLGGELVRLEAVDVALVQVEGRAAAVDEPLGHGPADARRVGDPDRLGHPEARAPSADSPSSGKLSVVKENSPLMPSSTLASGGAGSSAGVSAQAGAKSSGGERQHRGHHLGVGRRGTMSSARDRHAAGGRSSRCRGGRTRSR